MFFNITEFANAITISVFSMAMVWTKQLVQLFGLPNSWSKP
jgi:hypothetical protein